LSKVTLDGELTWSGEENDFPFDYWFGTFHDGSPEPRIWDRGLAQRKVGPDPFELLDVLAEMNRRTGGDGEPIRRTGYRQPGARSWLEDYYDDWKALRAGSPGESP